MDKNNKTKIMNKKAFYTLSWTWGLPMTLVGAIVCGAILLFGLITKKNYRIKRHGWCYYIPIGQNWGGCRAGYVLLV